MQHGVGSLVRAAIAGCASGLRGLSIAFAFLFAIMPVAGGAIDATPSEPGIVGYLAKNYGNRQDNLVVTFGSIFARSDLPRGSGLEAVDPLGAVLPLQVDSKASHPDGSLRHAVITVAIPHLAPGKELAITLRRANTSSSGEHAISLSELPDDFDAVVVLKTGDHRLAASARALLDEGKKRTWLEGPLVTEWWVSGPFRDERGAADPHMSARFGIRCYGKGRPLRLDVIVENSWTFVPHPQTELYDVEIRAHGRTVFTKTAIEQPSHTRWREVFWWDAPAAVYLVQNLDYLKRARVVPNYEPGLQVSEAALSKMYARFERSDRDPMATGLLTAHMGTTGGRLEIAPLPQWQAMYLLSMDPRAYEMTLVSADLGASFPVHYRNEKTGLPTTLQDDPRISVSDNLLGKPGQLDRPDNHGQRPPATPDSSHEAALDFIPYLVTGDLFYLEELEFWATYNPMEPAPEYRGFDAGLLKWDQPRGQAWSLRTLAQAAYIAPDADTLKKIFRQQLRANVDWYEKTFSANPSANRLGVLVEPNRVLHDGGRSVPPWQLDFLTWSIGYVNSLGDVDVLPLLRWNAKFPVGRMIAPGFCWILGVPLRVARAGRTGTGFLSELCGSLPGKPSAQAQQNRRGPFEARLCKPRDGGRTRPETAGRNGQQRARNGRLSGHTSGRSGRRRRF